MRWYPNHGLLTSQPHPALASEIALCPVAELKLWVFKVQGPKGRQINQLTLDPLKIHLTMEVCLTVASLIWRTGFSLWLSKHNLLGGVASDGSDPSTARRNTSEPARSWFRSWLMWPWGGTSVPEALILLGFCNSYLVFLVRQNKEKKQSAKLLANGKKKFLPLPIHK